MSHWIKVMKEINTDARGSKKGGSGRTIWISLPRKVREAIKEYKGTDSVFKKACDLASVPATKRQHSKYEREMGAAFKQKRAAAKEVHGEQEATTK